MKKLYVFGLMMAGAVVWAGGGEGNPVELAARQRAIAAAKLDRAKNLVLKETVYHGEKWNFSHLSARPTQPALKGAVMYQLFLRMFTPEGTLNAARERLPFVRSLGTDIVYLCPVALSDRGEDRTYWSGRQKQSKLNNPCNPYRIADYFAIDPEYGSAEDLKAFVEEVHRLGMKIYFDLVYYHCGPNAVFLKDKPEWVLHKADGSFDLGKWAFPRFDLKNAEVREYFFENMKWYLTEFKCDGFRCDVGEMLPLWYREEADRRNREVKSDVVMMDEGHDPRDQQASFDLDYCYRMQWAIGRMMRGGSATNLWSCIVDTVRHYPKGYRWMRCFQNHDFANCAPMQKRAELEFGKDMNDSMLATIFTLDGVPMIYDGQEIADTARHSIWGNRDHGKLCIDWSRAATADGQSRLSLVKALVRLRHENKELFDAPTEFLTTDHPHEVYAYLRKLNGGKTFLTAVNVSTNAVQVKTPKGFRAALSGPKARLTADGVLFLGPKNFVVAERTAAQRHYGASEFDVEQPRTHGGPVLKAADFGISPTNIDNAAAINLALAEAKRLKASRLDIPKGTYRCHGPSGIVLDGLEDFVLDAHDSLFLFWRKSTLDWDAKKYNPKSTSPEGNGPCLTVKNCLRVRVENVKSDWDWSVNPLGFLCRCVNKHIDDRQGESYVDLELMGLERHPLYPNSVPVQLIMPMNEDGSNARMNGSGARCYIATGLGIFGSKNEWLAPNRLRLWTYVPMEGRPQGGGVGSGTISRNRGACNAFDVGGVFAISHYYYGMSGVNLTSNRHVTLRNYALWSCRGHGLGIGGTEKYTWLDNFRLAPPDPEEVNAYGAGGAYRRSVTATSDGTHVGRCLGYVKMTDCEWSMHNDDSVNFHDCSTIARAISSNRVQVVNNFGTRYLSAQIGHEIELRQEDYSITGWRGKIVAMDDRTFTFDHPLPEQKGLFFVLFDRAYSTEHLLFRNCLFHKTPWARNLILASNVTFDGCRFEDTLGSPLRFQTCYTYNVWCEGTGCTNVLVRGCTFKNCADSYTVDGVSSQIFTGVRVPGTKGWPERLSCPIYDAKLKAAVEARLKIGRKADVVPCADIVNTIVVENNTFVNPRSYAWYALNGDNLIYRNNRVVFDGNVPYAIRPEAGGTRFDQTTRVQAFGNECK